MSQPMITYEQVHQALDSLPEAFLADIWQHIMSLKSTAPSPPVAVPPMRRIISLEGVWAGYDFPPEAIAAARRELWAGFGEKNL